MKKISMMVTALMIDGVAAAAEVQTQGEPFG